MVDPLFGFGEGCLDVSLTRATSRLELLSGPLEGRDEPLDDLNPGIAFNGRRIGDDARAHPVGKVAALGKEYGRDQGLAEVRCMQHSLSLEPRKKWGN